MKNYVITIQSNHRSALAADRCIKSGKRHGTVIEIFNAITPEDPLFLPLQKEIGNTVFFEERWSRKDRCIAAFLSHYSLWKMAMKSGEEVTVFEHDAYVEDKIPTVPYNGLISFGAPSYGKFITPKKLGVNPLTSKRYLPGAHCYRVSPAAAEILVAEAQSVPRPTDLFINIDTFPFVQEYYPWPVRSMDGFSTIQNEHGCKAKHNYGPGYDII